jgi:hypothetical protein
MPRHPLGEQAMTAAERQARFRAARVTGTPPLRLRQLIDHRSRNRRWHNAVATLTALQAEAAAWLEILPANLPGSASAGALQAIEPPRGFGRE